MRYVFLLCFFLVSGVYASSDSCGPLVAAIKAVPEAEIRQLVEARLDKETRELLDELDVQQLVIVGELREAALLDLSPQGRSAKVGLSLFEELILKKWELQATLQDAAYTFPVDVDVVRLKDALERWQAWESNYNETYLSSDEPSDQEAATNEVKFERNGKVIGISRSALRELNKRKSDNQVKVAQLINIANAKGLNRALEEMGLSKYARKSGGGTVMVQLSHGWSIRFKPDGSGDDEHWLLDQVNHKGN